MFDKAVKEIKKFHWEKILSNAIALEEFNKSKWRFLKSDIIEQTVTRYSNSNLVLVDEVHKDCDWPSLNTTLEIKSVVSNTMYNKRGKLRRNFTVKLTNSNGTNTKDKLEPSEICDIILFIFSDGAFVIDDKTACECLIKDGDGFKIKVPYTKIIPLQNFPYLNIKPNKSMLELKTKIFNLIEDSI